MYIRTLNEETADFNEKTAKATGEACIVIKSIRQFRAIGEFIYFTFTSAFGTTGTFVTKVKDMSLVQDEEAGHFLKFHGQMLGNVCASETVNIRVKLQLNSDQNGGSGVIRFN